MTDTADDFDLGDFADEQVAEAAPPTLEDIFERARVDAMLPKPALREMVNTLLTVGDETEGVQNRLLLSGVTKEPTTQYMRRAAVLIAAAKFLELIDANQDAVRAVLRKRQKT